MTPSPFRGPVFVIGTARSGTKLLRSLLNEHPDISIPEVETEMLPWLATHFDQFGDLSDFDRFVAFHRWCQGLLYFRNQHARGVHLGARTWYEACRTHDVAGVFEALVRHDAGVDWDSDRLWGDKSPSHMRFVALLARLYPRSRFVHITRDARDVALSARQAWGKSVVRTAQRWADDIELARKDSAGLAGRYVEVRFEDLLERPSEVLRQVTDVLGVAFDPAMTSPSRPTENLGTARGRSGLHLGAAGRWRVQMGDRDRRAVERVAGRVLQQLGYDLPDGLPAQRRLGRVEARVLGAGDAANLAWRRLREWGVRDTVRYGWRTFRMPRP